MNRHLPRGVAALVLAVVSLAAPASALPDNPFSFTPLTDTQPPTWAHLRSAPTPSGETILLTGLAQDDAGLDRIELQIDTGGRFRNTSHF